MKILLPREQSSIQCTGYTRKDIDYSQHNCPVVVFSVVVQWMSSKNTISVEEKNMPGSLTDWLYSTYCEKYAIFYALILIVFLLGLKKKL